MSAESGDALGPDGEPLAPEVRDAVHSPSVLSAVAEVFRRNWRAAGETGGPAAGAAEALAREVVGRLTDPARFRQAERAGVRFDLEVGSALYPHPPVVWASVWDEDDGVWRFVARIDVPAPAPGAAAASAAVPADPRPLEVAAGVIVGPRGFLLTRRRQADHMGGCWEFPGGKREPGEPWTAALVRELREELGVEVAVVRFLGETHHHYPDARGPVLLRFFACVLARGEPRPLAAEALQWVPPCRLASLAWPDANLPMVRRLARLACPEELLGQGASAPPGGLRFAAVSAHERRGTNGSS